MTDRELREQASRAGLAVEWTDAHGQSRTVSPETLRAVLQALGDFEQPPEAPEGAERCFTVEDAAPGRGLAAVAVQLYALRGTGPFGDLPALAEFVRGAAAAGLDAVAVSPIYAPFLAGCDASPYAPSSRLFLNPLYAASGAVPDGTGDLVDWPSAMAAKLAALRAAFRAAGCPRVEPEPRLRDHARFEALDAHFRAQGLESFHDWPPAYRNPRSATVEAFARDHGDDIAFHIYLQRLTEEGLAAAQHVARESGMAIGLIADLAVGMSPIGSHAWSAPEEVLTGLTIGAPPDVYQPEGQDWGITALSPDKGRAAFAETLRRAMRSVGGVRIDHAMGLQRLWVIPRGAAPVEGVYLRYPMHEMLSIVAEQSRANRAIVIGEDLGTVDPDFRRAMMAREILGMEVLWFQREWGRFLEPPRWSRQAAALTATHDLPTVAGWWRARDLDWQERIGRDGIAAARRARDEDRAHLWSAIGSGPLPAPEDTQPVVEAALAFVGQTPCPLALVPVEDMLGLAEQPNIPGTTDQHPNWRRRLPPGDLFAQGRANLSALLRGRGAS